MRRAVVAVLIVAALLTGCSGVPIPGRSHARPVPATIAVFLRHDVTAAQREAIGTKLRAAEGVRTVQYISQEEAYRRFKKAFADKPELVSVTRVDQMFASYQARFVDRADADKALSAVRHLPGVQRAQVLPTPSPSATP